MGINNFLHVTISQSQPLHDLKGNVIEESLASMNRSKAHDSLLRPKKAQKDVLTQLYCTYMLTVHSSRHKLLHHCVHSTPNKSYHYKPKDKRTLHHHTEHVIINIEVSTLVL